MDGHSGFGIAPSRLNVRRVVEGASMEFSKLLIREHDDIRRALNILGRVTDQIQQAGSIDVHNVNALLLFLQYYAERCHHTKEESIVFPAIRRALKDQHIDSTLDLKQLTAEHREQCELIAKMQIALFSGDPAYFARQAGQLTRLVSEHLLKEERMVFPVIEELLPEPQTVALAVQIREANVIFGDCQLTLLMEMLKKLERAFPLKAA
jgi:hemerythrin-like domain-containing protein